MPVPEIKSRSGSPAVAESRSGRSEIELGPISDMPPPPPLGQPPESILRLCSLSESETQQKYERSANDTIQRTDGEKSKMAEASGFWGAAAPEVGFWRRCRIKICISLQNLVKQVKDCLLFFDNIKINLSIIF